MRSEELLSDSFSPLMLDSELRLLKKMRLLYFRVRAASGLDGAVQVSFSSAVGGLCRVVSPPVGGSVCLTESSGRRLLCVTAAVIPRLSLLVFILKTLWAPPSERVLGFLTFRQF